MIKMKKRLIGTGLDSSRLFENRALFVGEPWGSRHKLYPSDFGGSLYFLKQLVIK